MVRHSYGLQPCPAALTPTLAGPVTMTPAAVQSLTRQASPEDDDIVFLIHVVLCLS